MSTQHTPTPWTAQSHHNDDTGITHWIVHAPDGCPVARLGGNRTRHHDTEGNAAFIVRAVNAHDEMLAALRDCVESLERLESKDGAYRTTCLTQARAAIVKATEVQS